MNIRLSLNLSAKIGSVILLCILLSVSLWSHAIADNCTTKFEEIFSILPSKVGEYEKAATYKVYSPDTVFDYVNGNAYYLFDHGFTCLGVQEFRSNKSSMLLELYRFKSRKGAKAIYADEAAGNINKMDIGDEGSVDNCYLSYYYKDYFVKILCFDKWQGKQGDGGLKRINSNAVMVSLAGSSEGILIKQAEGYLASNKERKIAGQDINKENRDIVLIGASYAKGWVLGEVAGIRVLNKGISGEQSFEMLSRFDEDVISVKPKAVIIWGFINDIHRSDRKDINRTIERAKASIGEMVNLSKANGIIPILATELTIRPKDSWKETIAGWIGSLQGKDSYQDYVNQHVLDVNQWIRDYANQHDLLLLDLQPVISDENGQRKKEYAVKDGSHISQKGYEKLTEYAQGVLKKYFEKQ